MLISLYSSPEEYVQAKKDTEGSLFEFIEEESLYDFLLNMSFYKD
jgi:hypothetical protein